MAPSLAVVERRDRYRAFLQANGIAHKSMSIHRDFAHQVFALSACCRMLWRDHGEVMHNSSTCIAFAISSPIFSY
ncbi:hypothetical protein [Lysobacter gummosus]|uniref:hypothetical protein n=1 Tax=Lysobacter gummosus TaxID=262324 RepID=UPI0036442E29